MNIHYDLEVIFTISDSFMSMLCHVLIIKQIV